MWDYDRRGSNDFIGGLRLGPAAVLSGKHREFLQSQSEEVAHWEEVLAQPGEWVEHWHNLRGSVTCRRRKVVNNDTRQPIVPLSPIGEATSGRGEAPSPLTPTEEGTTLTELPTMPTDPPTPPTDPQTSTFPPTSSLPFTHVGSTGVAESTAEQPSTQEVQAQAELVPKEDTSPVPRVAVGSQDRVLSLKGNLKVCFLIVVYTVRTCMYDRYYIAQINIMT